jgi:hypothetical protein
MGVVAAALAVGGVAGGAELPSVAGMVEALASDEMQGRGAGSPELDAAGETVRGWLESAGAAPGLSGGWRQEFAGSAGEPLFNVVGKFEGTGEEWIVLGAHYDGLGVGPPGTDFEGRVLNGADDNASGVAALVTAARSVAGEGELARTVYVVAFSGEETGTLGSKAFVESPPRPLERCAAMLNLDTVGRIEDDRIVVFGTGTADEFPEILKGVNYPFGFDLAFNSEGAGAGDHAPFFAKGVPVLHFFSGAKKEYHGPDDDTALVLPEGIEKLSELVAEAVLYLAVEEEPLTFRPAGVERLAVAAPGAKKRRVSFGSIPDFSRESGGILLSGVMPGSAAEEAGLAEGDLLVELDGDALDTIHDFQATLSAHEPGDAVVVKFVRGDETREATVTLRERKR